MLYFNTVSKGGKMDFYVKVKDFNIKTGELLLKLEFLSGVEADALNDLMAKGKIQKWSVKNINKVPKTLEQLKKIYYLYQLILEYFSIPYTKENESALDLHLKRTLLKCDTVSIGGVGIPVIPTKKTMSLEEASLYIDRIKELYGKEIKKIMGEI